MKFLLNILLLMGIFLFVSGAPQFGRRRFGGGRFGGGRFGGGRFGGGGFGGPGFGGGGGGSNSFANAQSFSASFGPFSVSASNANSAANSFGFGR